MGGIYLGFTRVPLLSHFEVVPALGPVPISNSLCRQLSSLVNGRVGLGLGLLRPLLGFVKVDVFAQLFYDDNICIL